MFSEDTHEQIGKEIYSGGLYTQEDRWLVLDVENTVSHNDNKLHLEPFKKDRVITAFIRQDRYSCNA